MKTHSISHQSWKSGVLSVVSGCSISNLLLQPAGVLIKMLSYSTSRKEALDLQWEKQNLHRVVKREIMTFG